MYCTVSRRKCALLYQGRHAHAQLIGGSSEENKGAATQAHYQALQDDGHKDAANGELIMEGGKSKVCRGNGHNDSLSINVFASFVHSLSDMFVMIGVLIAAIVIKIKVCISILLLFKYDHYFYIHRIFRIVNTYCLLIRV